MSDDTISKNTNSDGPKGLHLVSINAEKIEPAPKEQTADDGANDEAKQLRISQLEAEHRDLDTAIITLEERMPYDRLTIQRLKKRKLVLKDQMTVLHAEILPDIIA